jgi:hypothetical protein
MRPVLVYVLVATACFGASAPATGALYAVRFDSPLPLERAVDAGGVVRLIGSGEAVVEGDDGFAERASDRGLAPRRLEPLDRDERPVVWYPGGSRRPTVGRTLWTDSAGTHVVAARASELDRLRSEAHQMIDLPGAIDVDAWFDPRPPGHLAGRSSRDERMWRGAVGDVIDAVSGDSLMAMTSRLSETPGGQSRTRYVFHEECLGEARPTIVSALQSYLPPGSPVETQAFTITSYTCEGGIGGPTVDNPAENIIGTLEGNGRLGGCYIVCGHYDATASSSAHDDSFAFWWCQHDAPGADDNATGVATVLEAARVLSDSGLEFPFDIRFVLFTAEELGLVGSDVYADSVAAAGDTIYGVVNVDMIGFKPNPSFPDTCHLVTNDASIWLADWMLETADLYQDDLPSFEAVRIDSPLLYSDHGSFWLKGYDGLVAIEHWNPRERNPYYHTINDRFATVTESQFTSTSRLVAGSLARLADPDGTFNLSVFPGDMRATPNRPFAGTTVLIDLDVHAFGPEAPASVTIELWDGEVDDGELLASYDVSRVVGSGETISRTYLWELDDGDVGDHDLTARVLLEEGPSELSLSDNVATTVLNVREEGPIRVLEHHPSRNPAHSLDETAIQYELSRDVQLVEIEVYDLTGQKVLTRTISERGQGLSSGWNEVSLGESVDGELASGVYIYRLRVAARDRSSTDDVVTGRFALVR